MAPTGPPSWLTLQNSHTQLGDKEQGSVRDEWTIMAIAAQKNWLAFIREASREPLTTNIKPSSFTELFFSSLMGHPKESALGLAITAVKGPCFRERTSRFVLGEAPLSGSGANQSEAMTFCACAQWSCVVPITTTRGSPLLLLKHFPLVPLQWS